MPPQEGRGVRRVQLTGYLSEPVMTALDVRAARAGLSRSAYVADLLERQLADTVSPELRYPAFVVRELVRRLGGDAMADAIDAEFDAINGPGAARQLLGPG